jgi:hypothetical protein
MSEKKEKLLELRRKLVLISREMRSHLGSNLSDKVTQWQESAIAQLGSQAWNNTRASCYMFIGMQQVRESIERDIVDLEDEIYLEEKGKI